MRLKNRLRTTKRGNLSISDHINKLTNVANNLAFVGKPVDDDNFVTLILNGNGPAYEAIVNSVQPTDSLISLDDLIGLLLNVKMRLEEQHALPIDEATTALYITRDKSSHHGTNGGAPNQAKSSTSHQQSSNSKRFP
ncbi:hypothetical protein AAC387_Pa07g2128 [Persea americana]